MAEDLLREQKELLLRLFEEKTYVPMKLKELAVFLDIPKARREELKAVLDILLEEGKIGISAKGKYGKARDFARVGIFTGHARGFGFVTVEGQEQDIFIPAEKTAGAMNGDKVQAAETDTGVKGKRPEGVILKVLERAN